MIIYEIRNTKNNKVYIGQTVQEIAARWYGHVAKSKSDYQHPLYNSMRKNGVDTFTIKAIDTATSIDELDLKEELHLANARLQGQVYNLRKAGGNKTHSPESIIRMQKAQTLSHKKRREEGREGGWTRKDGGAMKGKVHPAKGKPRKPMGPMQSSTKEKLSLAMKGRTWRLVDGKRVWIDREVTL